jgi:hypothetical protein
MMYDAEWDNSPEEQEFLTANVEAANRGATVERVFILSYDQLDQCLANPAIQRHMGEVPGLRAFFVTREYLRSRDPELLERAGAGFFKIGKRVALVDMFSQDEKARGFVTMEQSRLQDLEQTFNRLKILSSPTLSGLLAARQQPAKLLPQN